MKKNLLFIGVSVVLLLSSYIGFELLIPTTGGSRYMEVFIPKGASFRKAAEILRSQKLIRDRNVFLLLGRLTGADRRIRAGYYSLWGYMSPLDIFRIIRKGQIIEFEVRIIEGDSLSEIADTFEKAGIIGRDDFARLVRDPRFLGSYDIEAASIEGYLFPDTYRIPKGMSPEESMGTMIDRMRAMFSYESLRRAGEIGMTEHEVLTLASIIEKEAVVDAERPLISAVYHNRLKKNMPLQADPTAVYGIKRSGEKITRADLQRKTPHNTYVNKGLPPGPIASPGLKSIEAALYPSDVPYLYFVSLDDRSHKFSVTLSDHQKAVDLYRQRKQETKEKKEQEERPQQNETS